MVDAFKMAFSHDLNVTAYQQTNKKSNNTCMSIMSSALKTEISQTHLFRVVDIFQKSQCLAVGLKIYSIAHTPTPPPSP